jgi:hypothetical protein
MFSPLAKEAGFLPELIFLPDRGVNLRLGQRSVSRTHQAMPRLPWSGEKYPGPESDTQFVPSSAAEWGQPNESRIAKAALSDLG